MAGTNEEAPLDPELESIESLRRRAEKLIQPGKVQRLIDEQLMNTSVGELSMVIHELRIHQEELTLQNEELRRVQEELVGSRDRFQQLYNSAPVGFLTLDHDGRVLDANRPAATMLETGQANLKGERLTRFIAPESQDAFFLHRQATLANPGKHTCELFLEILGGPPVEVRMESVASSTGSSEVPPSIRSVLMDITEKREAEEWRILVKRMEQMVEELPAAAVFLENNELSLNRAAKELTGYDRGELATLDDWFVILNGERAEFVRDQYEELSKRGFADRSEPTTIRCKDGEERLIEFVFHRFDEHEVWLLYDLTERARSEKALGESEERLSLALRATRDRVWDCDLVKGTVWRNENYRELCGGGPEGEPESREWWLDRVHPDDRQRLVASLDAALESGVANWTEEYRFRRRSGEFDEILDRGYIIRDAEGKATRILGVMMDFTERIQAEADKARLAALVQSSPIALLELSFDGTVQHWNPAAEDLFGFSAEEAIGQNVNMLLPSDRAGDFENIVEELRGGGEVRDLETERRHKDGTPVAVALTVSQIFNSEGKATSLTAIARDIRERRRLERDIAAAAEEEQQRIARELHDGLGSMLTAIDWRLTGFGRALQRATLNDEGREALRISQEIRGAISQLRAVTQGLQPLGDDPADLIHALRALADHVRSGGLTNCRLLLPGSQVPPLSLPASGVAQQMSLIAREAVHNAQRHSGATHVTIQLKQAHGKVILSVADNGCGFDPEKHAGRTSKDRGIGIGTMKYRAGMIGAQLRILPRRSGGTRVICEV